MFCIYNLFKYFLALLIYKSDVWYASLQNLESSHMCSLEVEINSQNFKITNIECLLFGTTST